MSGVVGSDSRIKKDGIKYEKENAKNKKSSKETGS